MFDFDLIVIGGGSGGVACARRAAKYGARVGLIEESNVGGTCVHRGCIPKKFLVYASHFSHDFEDSVGYGWQPGKLEFDWSTLIKAKTEELQRLENIYKGLLSESGVDLIPGRGQFLSPNVVEVGKISYTAKNILIATGGWPSLPTIEGIELGINSNDVFDLPSKPERLIILGGGYIACEFAGIFSGLGSQVTQLYRSEMILRGFDHDIRQTAFDEMQKSGIDIRLGTNIVKIEENSKELIVTSTDGKKHEADQVIIATGRKPNTENLGLAQIGVNIDKKGAIIVDKSSNSSVPNIFAIGDCTNKVNLTPVAINEGRCLAETLFNNNPQIPSYKNIPTAVFTKPEIGVVGVSEGEAKDIYRHIDIYRTYFRPLKHTLSGRDEKVFMKLIVNKETDCVVGCHMIGEGAGEIVQILGIALNAGATKAQFDATMAVHPTSAEELVTMYEPMN